MPTKIQIAASAFNTKLAEMSKRLLPRQVGILQKKICIELFVRVILKTPVDTGRARGNWQCTIGEPAKDSTLDFDNEGQKTIDKMTSKVKEAPNFSIIYLTNNVVYILPLEYGHSKQAPNGMVAVSLQELSSQLKLKKKK